MKIGLVCMLKGRGMKKGFTGIKALEKLSQVEIDKKACEAALYNIDYTLECLKWVKNHGQGMFRVSSSLIPYNEFWNWKNFDSILEKLKILKKFAKDNNIRLIMHPDQFTVLNSENNEVVHNSIKILNHHYEISELLGVEDIIIHVGSSKGDYKERFIKNTKLLNKKLKAKILLENCHSVGIEDVIEICEKTGIRPCLDFHHDRIKPSSQSFENYIEKILNLSKNKVPLAHISSPAGDEKNSYKSHSEYISTEDLIKFRKYFDLFDVEIEAKGKEKAVKKVVDFFKKI
ncbi:UV DNA damage repair endonuclease UvsE [Ilyobacter polytropus]|uniref:UV-endonuclease UvdE n=1 Tax=Ilyobacter polytropus (strain ATCC 51220 / DSM 2926 / LMG 16218 / CuHBu1) TaxID=572544 RepID=E3HBB6_ILYPC|nr:UV DNA damage repair endonuclease UvsE [Ilyobacter polytropus]ADO82267.1 UV-endonuclease UvdE [Ilyobacter polytropus DSM 2926]